MMGTESGECCGKYRFFPDALGKRLREDGLRTKGFYRKDREDQPLVSIVTVVRNNAEKIERAIKSVIAQTYPNTEYIVVDGGSTDTTSDVVTRHVENIDYFISEPDEGIYDAINKGIMLARGRYIGILNSDDWYSRDAIEVSVAEILNTGADFSGGEEEIVDENENKIGNYGLYYLDERAYFSLNPFNHGTMFISARAYNAIGLYDTRFKIASDLKYQLDLVRHNFKGCWVNRTIHYFDSGGISNREQDLSIREVTAVISSFHPGLDAEEVEAIARLKYRNEVDWATIRMMIKVLKSREYTELQKEYLLGRVDGIVREKKTKREEPRALPSGSEPQKRNLGPDLIREYLIEKIRGTFLYRPLRAAYRTIRRR